MNAGRELGRSIAEHGLRLVYGGGTKGVMGAVALGAADGGGAITGIIPRFLIGKETSGPVEIAGLDLDITEDMPTAPTNPYGATKLAIDHAITSYARAHGLGATSLRYFNVAGAYGDIGENREVETHLIPLVLQVALGHREKISMFGDDWPTPDGTPVRDYIHIRDLADAHVLALSHPGRHLVQRRIHLLGVGGVHVEEVGPPTGGLELGLEGGHPLHSRPAVEVNPEDVVAGGGKGACTGFAESGGGAQDERPAPGARRCGHVEPSLVQ